MARRCAPDQAIEKFKKDKLELKFELLIDEIEKQPDYRRAVLSKIKKQAWKTMCSYAHGGFHQAVNRLTSGFIQPRYAEGAKVEVVNFSSAVALLSAAEIFSMARRQDLMEQAWSEYAIHLWFHVSESLWEHRPCKRRSR